MSLRLVQSGGVEASSTANPSLLIGGEHAVAVGSQEMGMSDATSEMRGLLEEQMKDGNPVILRYLRRLRSMALSGYDGIEERYLRSAVELNEVLDFDEPGPPIEVFGHELSSYDFAYFVDYVLTNTGVRSLRDPRMDFLASMGNVTIGPS